MDISTVQCGLYFNSHRRICYLWCKIHKQTLSTTPITLPLRPIKQVVQFQESITMVRIPNHILFLLIYSHFYRHGIINKQPRLYVWLGLIRHVHICSVCHHMQCQSAHHIIQVLDRTYSIGVVRNCYLLAYYGYSW